MVVRSVADSGENKSTNLNVSNTLSNFTMSDHENPSENLKQSVPPEDTDYGSGYENEGEEPLFSSCTISRNPAYSSNTLPPNTTSDVYESVYEEPVPYYEEGLYEVLH